MNSRQPAISIRRTVPVYFSLYTHIMPTCSLLHHRHVGTVCDIFLLILGKKWHKCLTCWEIIKYLSPRNTHENTNVREATGTCIQLILLKCLLCVIPWHVNPVRPNIDVWLFRKTCTPPASVSVPADVLLRQKVKIITFLCPADRVYLPLLKQKPSS